LLLETITSLELESTPELPHAILSNLVVNLTGQPGSFLPADLMQEYFSRLLEAVAEKKSVEYYGDQFVRDAISHNLHHFACLLNDLKDGVGLQHRSGRHSAKPELTVLTGIYREAELHSRRKGRKYYPGLAREVDDFRRGYGKLRDGKLKEWVNESIFLRSVRVPVDWAGAATSQDGGCIEDEDSETEASDGDEDNNQDPDEHGETLPPALALTFVVDEEIVIEEVDLTSAVESIVADNIN